MAKNDRKADSLLSLLLSIISMGLMIVGIISVTIQTFKPNGWFSQLWTKLMNNASMSTILAIPVVLFVFYILSSWYGKSFGAKGQKRIGDMAMYAMIAAGIYFLFNFVSTGSI